MNLLDLPYEIRLCIMHELYKKIRTFHGIRYEDELNQYFNAGDVVCPE